MRVAINALWRATTPSGICKHAAALARCLCLRDEVESVFLLIGSWQEQYFKQALQLSHAKLIIHSIDISNCAYSRNFWYLHSLHKIVAELGVDLLHLAFPVPLNRAGLMIPAVTTLHDLYPYDTPANFGFPRVLGHRMLLRQCLQCSDRIACVSDFTRGRLATLFGRCMVAKSARIYNCVEVPQIPERRPPLKNLGGRTYLLCVAQHRRSKNIELLLEGFAVLLAEGRVPTDSGLVIVGSAGPETQMIQRTIAKLALCAHVILANGITDAELAWLYQNTLLTLCTSVVEGFGMPVAEAAQYGARIVCSDIPALREIGGDNCTFFSLSGVNPVLGFVRACAVALEQPSRPKEHNPLFSAETIAAQYVELYSQLLQSRLRRAA